MGAQSFVVVFLGCGCHQSKAFEGFVRKGFFFLTDLSWHHGVFAIAVGGGANKVSAPDKTEADLIIGELQKYRMSGVKLLSDRTVLTVIDKLRAVCTILKEQGIEPKDGTTIFCDTSQARAVSFIAPRLLPRPISVREFQVSEQRRWLGARWVDTLAEIFSYYSARVYTWNFKRHQRRAEIS
ncbi:MAG: hypothetical protein Q8R13_00820 [bacterium]|nr:hypothetical protein [bacterium]MDZ4296616.1 hypothetical protein [Patescibacteria group bacterium]